MRITVSSGTVAGMGECHMSLSSAAHTLLSKLSAWWHDREDERLDELMASQYRNSDTTSSAPVTALDQWAARARNNRRES